MNLLNAPDTTPAVSNPLDDGVDQDLLVSDTMLASPCVVEIPYRAENLCIAPGDGAADRTSHLPNRDSIRLGACAAAVFICAVI